MPRYPTTSEQFLQRPKCAIRKPCNLFGIAAELIIAVASCGSSEKSSESTTTYPNSATLSTENAETSTTATSQLTQESITSNASSGATTGKLDDGCTIVLFAEDFESGSFSKAPWMHAGDAGWEISENQPYTGSFAAKSGKIANEQISTLELTVTLSNPCQITFWHRESTEDAFDYLEFSIDGQWEELWSGVADWSFASFPVTEGEHTLQWSYHTDVGVMKGESAVYIDDLIIGPLK